MNILLLDRDPHFSLQLKKTLLSQGINVEFFTDIAYWTYVIKLRTIDVIVVNASDDLFCALDAFIIWRRLDRYLPVIFMLDEEDEDFCIQAFSLGVNDVLFKQNANTELAERLSLVMHNVTLMSNIDSEYMSPPFLDECCNLFYRNGYCIQLTDMESRLLGVFLSKPNEVVTIQFIMDFLVVAGISVSAGSLRCHIHSIRKKLGERIIISVYGCGYKLGDVR
ncbi:TPA: response regulator transcription factor [Salmonella enterica subsp. houtenae]|nr:response regulator transcription factor [Salmonella enterica subsp. houtenae]